jgi:hypothetical protein
MDEGLFETRSCHRCQRPVIGSGVTVLAPDGETVIEGLVLCQSCGRFRRILSPAEYAALGPHTPDSGPPGPAPVPAPAGPPTGPHSPAEYNRDDAPTGRVFTGASASVTDAAAATDARGHRAIILRLLAAAGDRGLTSKEAARRLPRTADGDRQLSNRSSSRLGELWELGQATVIRSRGACILGVCHPHHKPEQVHRPTAPCTAHGAPMRRDKANIWRLTTAAEAALIPREDA